MSTIANYLKYAHVQMAAEAFLERILSIQTLRDGNGHASKFSDTLADDFLREWTVAKHEENTGSGFSATLFKGRGQYAGELVLSFRSTEFVGDAVRDTQVTNKGIADTGWAFGQIADMREWWESSEVVAAVGGSQVTVAGYSLGGHLANAFNVLYQDSVKDTYTYNGAGSGQVSGSLHDAVNLFQAIADNPGGNAALFDDMELTGLYQKLTGKQNIGTGAPGLLTQTDWNRIAELPITSDDSQLLLWAVGQVLEVQEEHARVRGIVPADQQVALADIDGLSIDYWLGLHKAGQYTQSTNTFLATYNRVSGGSFGKPTYDVYEFETV